MGEVSSHAIFSIANARKVFSDLSPRQLARYSSISRNFVANTLKITETFLDSFFINCLSSNYSFLKLKTSDVVSTQLQEIASKTNLKVSIEKLSKKRKRYSFKEKKEIICIFEEMKTCLDGQNENYSQSSIIDCLVSHLHTNVNYNTVDSSMIRRWINRKDQKKRSRLSRFYAEYEEELLTTMFLVKQNNLSNDSSSLSFEITYSIIHSYSLIRTAAAETRKKAKYLSESYDEEENKTNCNYIQALKFSNRWCHNVLVRHGLFRRRCTRKFLKLPTPEEIKTIMEKNQSIYFTGGYTPGTTINMDETAYTYAIGPKYAFVPKDSERGESLPGEDEKLRVTAVISVTTEGNFLPNMIIIKHSRKSDDETHFRVIKSLHKLPEFGREDSWEVKEWSKIIPRKNKNTNQIEQIKHKAFYLINLVNGQVITSQHNAWMDEVKMSMYVDVILKTFKEENSKLFLWMDNCPSHCTQFIKNELTNNSIDYALFPPNMTAILQILDLVVNGPIKASHTKEECFKNLLSVPGVPWFC
jgi:hypothetical protein